MRARVRRVDVRRLRLDVSSHRGVASCRASPTVSLDTRFQESPSGIVLGGLAWPHPVSWRLSSAVGLLLFCGRVSEGRCRAPPNPGTTPPFWYRIATPLARSQPRAWGRDPAVSLMRAAPMPSPHPDHIFSESRCRAPPNPGTTPPFWHRIATPLTRSQPRAWGQGLAVPRMRAAPMPSPHPNSDCFGDIN